MWKNYFSQLLNVHMDSDIGKIVIYTVQSLVPETRLLEVNTVTAKLETYKFPGVDNILAELIQTRNETFHSQILKLVDSIWNKEELPLQ
jgi:hypothetical protein